MPKLDKPGDFGNSLKLAKGVYASLVTIVDIIDLSNYPGTIGEPNKRNDGTPFDLCVEVKYKRDDGEDWSTRFWGDFKKDEVTGRIKGWKVFANGVYEFFVTMLGSHELLESILNDDWSISRAMLDLPRGKKFYRISYIAGMKEAEGKGRWKDFNRIFLEGTTIEQMQNVWAEIAPKMKSYRPDVIDELERMKEDKDTKFDFGANISQNENINPLTGEEEFDI